MTTAPIILTLRKNTAVTDISEQIAYIIKYFWKAPKSMNDTLRDYMVSYMDIVSTYTDIPTICNQCQIALTGVFTRMYGNGSAAVSVTSSTEDGVNYSITIDVTVTWNDETYGASDKFTVDSDGKIVLLF